MTSTTQRGSWLTGKRWWLLPTLLCVVLLGAALVFCLAPRPRRAHANGQSMEPRASVADYSWSDLATLASELSSCTSRDEAVRLAACYGLCGEDGTFDASATKDVTLTDYTVARAVLADVWHDDRTDGGKAGLTFVLADAVGPHAMNHDFEQREGDDADSRGGWAASDMRAWLNGDLARMLPADLRAAIVSVQKHTANYVESTDEQDEPGHLSGAPADWASETSDRLWLLSVSELCGTVPASDNTGIDQSMASTYASEGAQYRLFAECNAKAFEKNDALVRSNSGGSNGCTWWLRSKTLEFDEGFWLVGTDGCPLNGYGEDARVVEDPEYAPDELWGPDHARGVVFDFCL
ncbi:MAG: hypothetical protein IKG22_09760 [Atopobiaceae bacterium]|nr:hypothetical protein [Atopobiaceae bacterium]